MPRAIDFHVHLPTKEFMQVTLGPYAKAAERFFRTEVRLKDIEQIAADYAELDMIGVLLAWDAETATGLPPLGNDYIARIVERYPQQFIGFASVDPHKGKAAVQEIERAVKHMGLAGRRSSFLKCCCARRQHVYRIASYLARTIPSSRRNAG